MGTEIIASKNNCDNDNDSYNISSRVNNYR